MTFTIETRIRLPYDAKVIIGNLTYHFYCTRINRKGIWPFAAYTYEVDDNGAPRNIIDAFREAAGAMPDRKRTKGYSSGDYQ